MARKRIKAGCRNQKIKDDQSQDDNRKMVMDTYKAELPSNVMHQIISLMSTKLAVRASILSKEWRELWSSVPVIDFDEDEDGQPYHDRFHHQRVNFIKFVRRCLKRRGKDMSDIDKFRVHLRCYGAINTVDNWLTLAVKRNVKEVEISIIKEKESGVRLYDRPYYVPRSIFKNANSVTTLKLQNVTMKDITDHISLPSLKAMSLKRVEFRSFAFFLRLISGCHPLEHLVLTSCRGLSDLEILSSSLKYLEVVDADVCGIKVEAVNLESLKFHRNVCLRFTLLTFDIFSCQRVRRIEFCGMYLTREWCEGFNSSFPLLDSLALHQCHSLENYEHIEFSSENMKRLAFSNTTPINPFFSLKIPNLSEARIDLRYRPAESDAQSLGDFRHLRNFVESLNCSRKITLYVTFPELCTFPESIRNSCPPPLPSLEHLEVEIGTFTMDDKLCLDKLLALDGTSLFK